MKKDRKILKLGVLMATVIALIVFAAVYFFNSKNKNVLTKEPIQHHEDNIKETEKTPEQINEEKYSYAVSLMEQEKFDEAMTAFEELGDYKDSPQQIYEVKYRKGESILEDGNDIEAALIFMEINYYKDAVKKIPDLGKRISAGANYSVGLMPDGLVIAEGDNSWGQCDVDGWRDVVCVDACFDTMGIRADGTVVATAHEDREAVKKWRDIVLVCNEEAFKVGLKSDGTVVCSKGFADVKRWRDIVGIAAGDRYVLGLKADGTVVASCTDNSFGQCNVEQWRDVVKISAGFNHSVGLRADGTVVAVGDDAMGMCNVSDWGDIVGISAGAFQTVGLRSDGTVVTTSEELSEAVSAWRDIVGISAGYFHVMGLKKDGTVVVAGSDDSGQCSGVENWKLF